MLKDDAEMPAEDMEGINNILLAGEVGQTNSEEPGQRVSSAIFLPGVEMEGDTLGRDGVQMEGDMLVREEVEAGAHVIIINDSNKTDDEDNFDEVKLSKKMPKRRKIFGRTQSRGGNQKLGYGGDGIAYIPPVAPTRFDTCVPSITSNIKYIPKKTLLRHLHQMEVNILILVDLFCCTVR